MPLMFLLMLRIQLPALMFVASSLPVPQPKSDRAHCSCAGAFAQLTLTLCGQNASHKVYWSWYCQDTRGAKIVRDVGTGILPEILLVVWQALLLPRVLYYIGQARFPLSKNLDACFASGIYRAAAISSVKGAVASC